ncbi:MAG: leucine--tRNA ligase [Sphingomonadales bacterium]|nr:leucine--tRNA ligase [Sphingomonadales bacterium]
MAQYPFSEIEKKWQTRWAESALYKVTEDPQKPKYYVLDMFPYPSGAGLHVGHPLGYIASDIMSRYKRLKGFNVLHPMGYDAFGLPAEQYAIQTGQHPAKTTAANIETFRRQLDLMGFSYDWSREVRTCEPEYYRWTQWIFGQFFNHWYDKQTDKARSIAELDHHFSLHGTSGIHAACTESMQFTTAEWNVLSPKMKSDVLNNYRLAFIDFTTVNWCQELGCVLANEEVVNHPEKGPVSERGGYPVVRKKMKQWSLRITAYADRLLKGLYSLDWSDSIKEIQRNWIGRSEGAEIQFTVDGLQSIVGQQHAIEVFTTRPDTLFGATFLVLAPEYEGLYNLCTVEQREAVKSYSEAAKNRSEIDRMADTRKTGIFTGAYANHPFTGKPIPVWVSDYVLAGYGTGAIMAVPAHDERDFEFAKAFNLPVTPVIKPSDENLPEPLTEAFSAKEGVCFNSDFLNGLSVKEAIQKAIEKVENEGLGKRKVNYKLREAGFGRQRYWGEPFPIVFDNEQVPHLINELPVELPKVESYKPTGTGESPLAGVKEWVETHQGRRETDTMPGWAGSSWYFLRYMDPGNKETFAGQTALDYWKQVDLYVGGSEHATGHLLYSRFWTKFLFDLGYLSVDEPFNKLVNQGMIMGEDGQKMSKRWGNVVNPDDVCAQYGADTLRMYEMFLGPLTDSKPWNTNGIEGVSRFLSKFWRLFEQEEVFSLSNEIPSKDELKILHKTIKKITGDIEQMSFNTAVSAFMVATNELGALQCKKRAVLEPLIILIAPFAPHIAEELWQKCGHNESIHLDKWPAWDEQYLVETHFEYPISINGKTRTTIAFDLNADAGEIEATVLADETVQRWMDGKPLKKFILVKGRIINVVV